MTLANNTCIKNSLSTEVYKVITTYEHAKVSSAIKLSDPWRKIPGKTTTQIVYGECVLNELG